MKHLGTGKLKNNEVEVGIEMFGHSYGLDEHFIEIRFRKIQKDGPAPSSITIQIVNGLPCVEFFSGSDNESKTFELGL